MREGCGAGLCARGRGRPRHALRLFSNEPREAARQHLAHHRVVVARRQARALDVEGAVLVFDETLRPGDDHRADRVGPHDVRIVVDLDPPRRRCEAEGGGERFEQLRLARRFGELARQRLARVAQRVVDELLLFAAARRADSDAMAGARAEDLA